MDRTSKIILGTALAVLGSWPAWPALADETLVNTGKIQSPDGSGAGISSTPRGRRVAQRITVAQADPTWDAQSSPQFVPGGSAPASSGTPQYTPGAPATTPAPQAGRPTAPATPAPQPGQPAAPSTAAPQPGQPAAPGEGMGTTAPGTPGAPAGAAAGMAPTPGAAANAAAPDFSPAAGGVQSGASSAFNMLGDMAPIFGRAISAPFGRPTLPGTPHQPGSGNPNAAGAAAVANRAKTAIPYLRATKFSDNQSPIPLDRVFSNFNYFNNVNYATNQRFNAPVHGIQIYRYIMGFEKTFLDGTASIGMSESLNNLSSRSSNQALGGTSTAMGDLSVFTKFIIWQDWEDDNGAPGFGGFNYPGQVTNAGKNGGLISGGLSLTLPTGPGSFAGSPFSKSFRNTQLQPYLGYYFTRGNFYAQGFESISVPTDPNDVTLIFNDFGIGYYAYRNDNYDTFLTAFAPTAEIHVNVPLNHRDVFNVKDIAGTQDVVDFTVGANFRFGQRTVLLLGAVVPASGPRPFSIEALALLNIYFGGPNRNRNALPMAGN